MTDPKEAREAVQVHGEMRGKGWEVRAEMNDTFIFLSWPAGGVGMWPALKGSAWPSDPVSPAQPSLHNQPHTPLCRQELKRREAMSYLSISRELKLKVSVVSW